MVKPESELNERITELQEAKRVARLSENLVDRVVSLCKVTILFDLDESPLSALADAIIVQILASYTELLKGSTKV